MQIRVANKQDEPGIRSFVEAQYAPQSRRLDLDGADADLRNIEANYFGREGLFIIVEDEGKIVGLAGARRKSDLVLEFKRLMSDDDTLEELIAAVSRFAPRLLYEKIEFSLNPHNSKCEKALLRTGFKLESSGCLALQVVPDF